MRRSPTTRGRLLAGCAVTVGVATLLGGCTSPPGSAAASTGSTTSSSPATTSAPSSHPVTPTPTPTPKPTPTHATAQLPQGGTKILGHYRIVAYYGTYGAPALGVLGSAPPEQIVTRIEQAAAPFRAYGLPVQPAMELIATVARASPGPAGTYSAPIPDDVIARYVQVTHRNRMLLVLDLQPGRAEFIDQARALQQFLVDPSVTLALDPEWKVGPGETPGGGHIGSASAASINAVIGYLSQIVTANHLPDKLLVVHEFTPTMLPDRSAITPRPGVEVAFHADGFGSVKGKQRVYRELALPARPYGTGFKVFYRQDIPPMTPAQVMALNPRPDIVTYQ